MDPTAFGLWINDHWQSFTLCALMVSTACSFIVSLTPTPPPGTGLAKIYHWLELAGVVFGYAKDHGLITPTPAMTAAAGEALQLGQEVVSTIRGRPSAPAPQQLGADGATTAQALIAALKEAGMLRPVPARKEPPAINPAAPGAAVLLALVLCGFALTACTPAQQQAADALVPAVISTAEVVFPQVTPALTAAQALACTVQADANALPPTPLQSKISTEAGIACKW